MSSEFEIRPDMFKENRNETQYMAPMYLDRFFLDAFTARTVDSVRHAETNLSDIQEQCLNHIGFLTDLEGILRSTEKQTGYEMNEEKFTELVGFIAGVGQSVAGVNHQLGFGVALDREGS